MPIVRVDERHWMAHPCGYRTLFHGVEMALVSEDESSSEDEADEEEKEDENEESNDQEKTDEKSEEPSTSTDQHVQ